MRKIAYSLLSDSCKKVICTKEKVSHPKMRVFGNTRGKPGNKLTSKFDSSADSEFMKGMEIQIIRIIKHLLSSLGRE